MKVRKTTQISSTKTPLWFGDYEGKNLEEILHIDKLYVLDLLKDQKFTFPPRVVQRLVSLYEDTKVGGLSNYKRITSYTVRDTAGKRLGYFVFDPVDVKNSEALDETDLKMELIIKDGEAVGHLKR